MGSRVATNLATMNLAAMNLAGRGRWHAVGCSAAAPQREHVIGNQGRRVKTDAFREELDEALAVDGGCDAMEVIVLEVIHDLHLHARQLGNL
jgi:hypothetical protein